MASVANKKVLLWSQNITHHPRNNYYGKAKAKHKGQFPDHWRSHKAFKTDVYKQPETETVLFLSAETTMYNLLKLIYVYNN